MSRSKVPVGGWFTSYDVRYDDHRPTDGTIVFRESDSARLHKQQPEESCDGGRGVSPHVHVGISTAIQAADAGTVLAAPSTRALRRNIKTTHTGVVKILDFYSAALRSQLQLSQPCCEQIMDNHDHSCEYTGLLAEHSQVYGCTRHQSSHTYAAGPAAAELAELAELAEPGGAGRT